MDSALSTVYFKSNLDRGGTIENIFVRNINVERAKGAFIRFESNYKGQRGNHFPPLFRNFVLENILCKKADHYGIFAEGVPDSRLQNILLQDIRIDQAKVAWRIRFADNFVMDNVLINGKKQPRHPQMSPEKAKLDMGW